MKNALRTGTLALAATLLVVAAGCASKSVELNRSGIEALERSDLDAASRSFREALAVDGGDAFALNNLGAIAELKGDYEASRSFYARAVATGSSATAEVNDEEIEIVALAATNLSRVEKILEGLARRCAAGPACAASQNR